MNKFIIIILLLFSFQAYSQKKPISKNAREIVNSDGTITRDIFTADVFYKNSNNEYVDVDNRFLDYGDYWIMNQNNHTIRVRKNLKADSVFWFDYEDKDIILEPVMALYNNKNGGKGLIDTSWHFVVKDVIGYKKDDYTIRFENAFRNGIHLEVTTANNGFKINKIIDTNVLIFPNGAQWFDFIFRLKGSNNVDYDGWDKQSLDSSKEVIRLTNVGKYIIDKPKSNKENKDIKIVLSKQNTQLYITKRIRGLSDGEGITTDIDITGETGDGYSNKQDVVWSTARNASTGIFGATATSGDCNAYYNGSLYSIHRAYFLFAMGLGSNQTIVSASLNLYTFNVGGTNSIAVVSNIATSLDANTYSKFGSVLFSSPIQPTNNAYKVFNLNANALAYLDSNKTLTYAPIGVINYTHDFLNTAPTTTDNYHSFYMADNATNKPYLSIIYTSSSTVIQSKSPHIINMKGF